MGYLLSGELQIKLAKGISTLHPGEVIYLVSEIPLEWKNVGAETARILWVKMK